MAACSRVAALEAEITSRRNGADPEIMFARRVDALSSDVSADAHQYGAGKPSGLSGFNAERYLYKSWRVT